MKRILNIDHLNTQKKYKLWWLRERLICKFEKYLHLKTGRMARLITLDHRYAYGLVDRDIKSDKFRIYEL